MSVGEEPPRRIRLVVVFGGRSAEHEVSVVSAGAVLDALDPGRYEVTTVGIDKQGGWHVLPGLPSAPPDDLPVGVIALVGWTNRLAVLSAWAWVVTVAWQAIKLQRGAQVSAREIILPLRAPLSTF